MDVGTENTERSSQGGLPGRATGPERRGLWRRLLRATSFLTILPVPVNAAPSEGPGFLRGVAPLFPVVGAGIGGIGALVIVGGDALGLGMAVSALAGLGAMVLLTGALHEDGLADVADGFGGGWSRDERLRIMRDSRLGTFGVLAIVLSVGLRASALFTLGSAMIAALGLIAAAAVSRAAIPVVMLATPPARADGAAASAGGVTGRDAGWTVLVGIAVATVCLAPIPAAAAIVAAVLGAAAVATLAKRAIGGHTGDVLGAAQQVAETAFLITLVGIL